MSDPVQENSKSGAANSKAQEQSKSTTSKKVEKPKDVAAIQGASEKAPSVAVSETLEPQETPVEVTEAKVKKEDSAQGELPEVVEKKDSKTAKSPKKDTKKEPQVTKDETTIDDPKTDKPKEVESAKTKAAKDKSKEVKAEEDKSKEDKSTESKSVKDKPTQENSVEDNSAEDEDHVESSDDEHEDEKEEESQEEEVDYGELSMNELIDAFKKLVRQGTVPAIKQQAEAIREAFNDKFQEEFSAQKEVFLAEGGNIIDFHYSTPQKKAFNDTFFDYKEKLNSHYRNLKKDLQANLSKRLELIEELKGLLSLEENINTTYKHFKDIQERWREAGAIQRDKYNTVWNTYHHHVENFYDFLHLNREFRDLDFKHNLDQKLKIISRAEDLAAQDNVQKAFRELQMLHKMWKEEIGPVAKEFRDEVWEKFSAATKIIHDKRHAYQKEQEKSLDTNYLQKQEIVSTIKQLSESTKPTHQSWQNAIKNAQELRNLFFEVGKVPRAKNQEIWESFKEATKNFNKHKNEYYKNQKKEQYANLALKQELVKVARENKDSDDFEATTILMKKIQGDWKKIGHVPRKESDKIWKEFKQACNQYFDRLHATKNQANKDEIAAFEAKKQMLDELSKIKLPEETTVAVDLVKEKIKDWKAIGRVPYNKKQIEGRFNKELDTLFAKLDLDKKEIELIKFENKMNQLLSQNDERKIYNERAFLSKKIDEVVQEINQLENNLGFFQHQDDKNPLVQDVHKNIKRHKESLAVWKAKLKKLKSMQ